MDRKAPDKDEGGWKKDERDGMVYLWQGYHGEIEVITFPKLSTQRVRRVAIGTDHTIFCTEGGQVYTCGSNKYGQLGIGSTDVFQSHDPVFVETLKDVCTKDIGCGSNHCAVVSSHGDVYCWGESSSSQCGQKTERVMLPYKVLIQQVSDDICHHGNPLEVEDIRIVQVSCGTNHTMTLSRNGEIWGWGSGKALGLKDVSETQKPTCVQKLASRNVLSISCGSFHTLALVEKSVLHDDVTVTPRSSRSRSSVLDTVTHEFLPSTCAKCHAEIYSYKELNDTCIIIDDHKCEESCSESKGPSQSSQQSLTNREGEVDDVFQDSDFKDNKLKDVKQNDKVKDDTKTGEEGSSNVEQEKSAVGENKPGEASRKLDFDAKSDDSQKDIWILKGDKVCDKSGDVQGDSAGDLKQTKTNDENGDKSNQGETGDNTAKDAESVVKTKKDESHTSSLSKSTDSSLSPTSSKDTLHLDRKVSRSKSIIDEKEARQYLSEQLEEKEEEKDEGEKDETKNPNLRSTLGSLLSSMQSYPADMIQSVATVPYHVTSVTSRAISNITDRFSFVSGAPVSERDDKSDSSGLGSHLLLLDLDTSDEDLQNISLDKTEQSGDVAESSFIDVHTPRLSEGGSEDVNGRLHEGTSLRSRSARTVEVKQERMEKEKGNLEKQDLEDQAPLVTIETEVWGWGKNTKGQLGLSDEIDREEPTLVKMLSDKHVVKLSAGGQHSLALTANSQVYTWGLNASGQLGRSEDPTKPTKIQMIQGCYIWDIGAGNSFSIFLVDRAGFQPEVHYVGKHPTRDLYVPVFKTNRLVALNCLKQAGWIRSISAGGDGCGCLSCWSFTGFTGTLFEVAATERRFYHYLYRILVSIVQKLKQSQFYKTMDVYPYKSAMQNLLAAFERITTLIGESSTEMSEAMRHGGDFLSCHFFTNYSSFIEEFKQYLVCFTDILAIAGFDFITKSMSSFFDKLNSELTKLLDITTTDKNAKLTTASKLKQLFARPFSHIKEYCRLAEKLCCNYPSDSEAYKRLNRVSLNWDSLRHKVSKEQDTAESTKAFWDTCGLQKLVDSIKVPSRRLIRDSKSSPLSLQGAGRMSTHNFLLFNDLFVHAQYSSFKVYSLDTLWVEASSSDNEKQQLIVLTMPEEKLTLIAPSSESKVAWMMAFNSTINKVLNSQKAYQRRGSTERLQPREMRHATHGFLRHGVYRDATYSGFWMNGKIHGHGDMKWSDGRKYSGNFKDGFQHGYGKLTIIQDDGKERTMEGYWRDGQLHGQAKVRYANGDLYEGHYKDGMRHGHGIYRQGQITSTEASVYVGEWVMDKKHGYGVVDDILKGEKYMGMWRDNQRHGAGIIVTLDGMYFEGNFVQDQLIGQGLMLTYDNSCYEGEFNGITQLQGKGKLTMSNGDVLEGAFSGSWNEGLKINGAFNKCSTSSSYKVKPRLYGTMCVPAEQRWEGMFDHCWSVYGVKGHGQAETKKAWENVAVVLFKGKKAILEHQKSSNSKNRKMLNLLEDLEKIPPYNLNKLTIEYYSQISQYLTKAFELPAHPLGKLMEGLIDVFRAAYIGIGAHPRLLDHAVKEIRSYVKRLYSCVRILFPDLPENGGPLQIFSENSDQSVNDKLGLVNEEEEEIEVVSSGTLLHPLLLPKIYPPLFDLYALHNDKEDEKYWERVKKLNKQGDIGLMAYLGIDQKFWMIDESMFSPRGQSISSIKNHFYTSSIEALQQISTAFSPKEKLEVIKQTFLDITKNMQASLGEAYLCCMDELFPLFQYVVVRAQIRHLGAEIHLIRDLMEPHLENGELGIMFTTLHACYFQIQNEKIPRH